MKRSWHCPFEEAHHATLLRELMWAATAPVLSTRSCLPGPSSWSRAFSKAPSVGSDLPCPWNARTVQKASAQRLKSPCFHPSFGQHYSRFCCIQRRCSNPCAGACNKTLAEESTAKSFKKSWIDWPGARLAACTCICSGRFSKQGDPKWVVSFSSLKTSRKGVHHLEKLAS